MKNGGDLKMSQMNKKILVIILFVLGITNLYAQSDIVDVQLVYNNLTDVDASLSNNVKVAELEDAIQSNDNDSFVKNLIVRIAFFDKNVVGRMKLKEEHKMSVENYVVNWEKMVENKNAVLFLFVKAFGKDAYEFNKMHLSGKLSGHLLSSVIELVDKQLTGDSNEIIAKGTHYLAEAIKFIQTKEKMAQATELTPFEIKICREYINTLKNDVAAQESLYLDLQTKVPYHSQVDNKEGRYETCNQTSLAMAFEMLGVSKSDFIKAIEENEINGKKVVLTDEQKELDFEDVLDAIRNNAELGNRAACATWEKLADIVGIKHRQIWVQSSKKSNAQIARINDSLRNGCGIVVSLFNYR